MYEYVYIFFFCLKRNLIAIRVQNAMCKLNSVGRIQNSISKLISRFSSKIGFLNHDHCPSSTFLTDKHTMCIKKSERVNTHGTHSAGIICKTVGRYSLTCNCRGIVKTFSSLRHTYFSSFEFTIILKKRVV